MAESVASYAKHYRQRLIQEAARRDARIGRARAEIAQIVSDFRRIDPDITSITLFGSLATDRVRSERFDIDLAVDCAPERYLALVSRALDSVFDVDLVELRSAPEWLRDVIARDGKTLYER